MSWEGVKRKFTALREWLVEQIDRRPRVVITFYVIAFTLVAIVAYDTRQKIVDNEAGRKQSLAIRQRGRAPQKAVPPFR